MTAHDILQAALALPEDERLKLIDALEASLPIDDEEAAFVAMLDQRASAAERGEPSVPAEEVFARLLAR